MKLSVVIVNYNVKHYLEQCLCSVYRAIDNLPAEVFVVDNASSDDSVPYLASRFPLVTYICNKENVGFARANNQAIRQAKGEYVLLLNPDTVLPEHTLEEVLLFMDTHPDAGASGVKMLSGDGRFLPESKRGYPTLTATFGKLSGLAKLFPRSKGIGGYYCNALDRDAVHRVDVLAGAFMLLRRSALDKTGLLDEDFFMYGEDIDLSCRIRRTGYENYYLPCPILHYKGESTSKKTYRHVRVFCEAMDIFFCKHAGHYSPPERFLVRTGIRVQMGARILALALRRMFCFPRNQARFASPNALRFLVFGEESTIHSLRGLFRRNGLTGKHHFVVANEISATEGHGSLFLSLKGFTHVVYDCRAFSFSTIIRLLSGHHSTGLHIGIYNPESRVLVTPENVIFETMKHTYFINERIRLRAMEPEDLELICEMENDPQLWDISNFTVPYSRYVMKQYMESSQCDMFADKQLRMMVVRLEDRATIGTIDITDFSPMHSRGEVGIVIRKEFRGAGYAKDALTLLCQYAFDFLRMRQLVVHIATDNAASLHLFASCGFVQCGLLRDWLCVEGCFKDVALLQCIRS